MLKELGVEFRFNTTFGKDTDTGRLRKEGFDAFFISIGAHGFLKLGIPGESDYHQVFDAIELLKRVALGERQVPGNRVLVIGGGNVAIDAARTCLRLGCEEVSMLYRRTRSEMPADSEEVEQAEEEGVRISFLTVPAEVTGKDGKLTGLRCLRAKLKETEDGGRKIPVPVEGSDYLIDADVIVTAIGQRVENSDIGTITGLKWTRRSTLDVNLVTMETAVEGIFAAGDAVLGPATIIEAIGGERGLPVRLTGILREFPSRKCPPCRCEEAG